MLVGHGRVGRRIASGLIERGIPYVVVEHNREQVEDLRKKGVAAVSGNAADPAVLIQAHIADAAMLVIATPDPIGVRQMAETARAQPEHRNCAAQPQRGRVATAAQRCGRHGVFWRGGTRQGHDASCIAALRPAIGSIGTWAWCRFRARLKRKRRDVIPLLPVPGASSACCAW